MAFGTKAGVPSGMAMMMKSFGIDPAQIMETGRKVGDAVKQMAGALERIERKVDAIAAHLGIEEDDGKQLTVAAGSGAGKISR